MITNTTIPKFDYDIEPFFTSEDMSNKLFCTFSTEEGLDKVLNEIQERYKIIYNKIFVYSPLENLFAQRLLDSVGVKYINYNFSSQEDFKYPPLYHFSSCDVFLFNKINSLIEHIPSFKKHYPKSFYLSFYSKNDPIHLMQKKI